ECEPNPMHARGETRLTENHQPSRHDFLPSCFSKQPQPYLLPVGMARRCVKAPRVPTSLAPHQAAVSLEVGSENRDQPTLCINLLSSNTPLVPSDNLSRD